MIMNNEQMKQLFGELIDQLVTSEQIVTIQKEIATIEALHTSSINKFCQEFNSSLHSLKETLTTEITEIKAQLATLKRELESFKTNSNDEKLEEFEDVINAKLSSYDTSFSLLAEKVAESFHNQKAAIEDRVNSIEHRTIAGESTMNYIRNEQDRVTSLLSQFASTISAPAAPKVVQQPVIDPLTISIPEPIATAPQPVQSVQLEQMQTPAQPEFTPDFAFESEPEIVDNRPFIASEIDEQSLLGNRTVEFEIDLSEIEFLSAVSSHNGDVIIDASGQRIYKA